MTRDEILTAARNAVSWYFHNRNNCSASSAYFRDCVRAAIRDVRGVAK